MIRRRSLENPRAGRPKDVRISSSSKMDLSIKPLKTAKSKIPQRLLMEKDIIPRHPSSVIFNGSSGSGKSTLLLNLLTRPEMFRGYFNAIYLFSPTGDSDDLFKHLKLNKKNIFTDMNPDDLADILEKQRAIIKKKGIDKAPRILFIFEDVQGSKKFMNSKPFTEAFIANRHFGASTWLCGQSFTQTPRRCRLQANNIFYFRGSGSESDLMIKEYCPPGMRKRNFEQMLDDATKEPYTFMHINKRAPHAIRYRSNLDQIIKY
jgi:hypothetical protein